MLSGFGHRTPRNNDGFFLNRIIIARAHILTAVRIVRPLAVLFGLALEDSGVPSNHSAAVFKGLIPHFFSLWLNNKEKESKQGRGSKSFIDAITAL